MNLKKDTEQQLRQILQEQAQTAVPDTTDPWTALQVRLDPTNSIQERKQIMPVETPVKPDITGRSNSTTSSLQKGGFKKPVPGRQRLILSGLALVVVVMLGVILFAALALPREGGQTTPKVAANPTPVASPVSGATVLPPSVTPSTPNPVLGLNGKLVYETRDPATNRSQIYLVQTGSNGPVTTKIGEGTSPIFSLDGNRVAFLVKTAAPAGVTPSVDNPDNGKISLVSVKTDGSDTQEYCTTNPGASVGLVGWQPDGKSIVWWLSQENSSLLQSCRLDTKQSLPLKLPSNANSDQLLSYALSADGKKALWQSPDRSASAARYSSNLFFGDPTRPITEATQLTTGQYAINGSAAQPELAAYQSYLSASISPDGKTVAVIGTKLFFVAVPGQQSPLAGKSFDLSSFGGTGWLVRSGAFRSPVWTADSQSLFFISGTSVQALNLTTGATTQVTQATGQIYNLSGFAPKS